MSKQIPTLFSNFSQFQSKTNFLQIESSRQINFNENKSFFLISNDDIKEKQSKIFINFDLIFFDLILLFKNKYVLYEISKKTIFIR